MEAEKLSKFSMEYNDIEINIPNFPNSSVEMRSHQLYKSIVYHFRKICILMLKACPNERC